MWNVPDSSPPGLSFREFRELARKHRREIEIAQTSMDQACEEFTRVDQVTLEQCDFVMVSIQALREAMQQFSALLHTTCILPDSIWSSRYSLMHVLCTVECRMRDLLLQIRVLRNVFQESSRWRKIQQQIRRDLKVLLADSNDSIINMNILIDRAFFIEHSSW